MPLLQLIIEDAPSVTMHTSLESFKLCFSRLHEKFPVFDPFI